MHRAKGALNEEVRRVETQSSVYPIKVIFDGEMIIKWINWPNLAFYHLYRGNGFPSLDAPCQLLTTCEYNAVVISSHSELKAQTMLVNVPARCTRGFSVDSHLVSVAVTAEVWRRPLGRQEIVTPKQIQTFSSGYCGCLRGSSSGLCKA